jgi:hypothetical protein
MCQPADLARPVMPAAAEAVNQHDRIVHFGVQGPGMQVEVDKVDKRAVGRLYESSWFCNPHDEISLLPGSK